MRFSITWHPIQLIQIVMKFNEDCLQCIVSISFLKEKKCSLRSKDYELLLSLSYAYKNIKNWYTVAFSIHLWYF